MKQLMQQKKILMKKIIHSSTPEPVFHLALSKTVVQTLGHHLFSSDDNELHAFEAKDNIDPAIKSAGINFPFIRRRKKLPDPVDKEKGVSLWSMIKDNIGKNLTKVCLPVYFNEPLSSLQKCFEDLEYSYLLDLSYEWGKQGNSFMRILNVAAFAVSGYASTDGRNCKPVNPLLGESYEADYPDKGLRFFLRKGESPPNDCSWPLRGYRVEIAT